MVGGLAAVVVFGATFTAVNLRSPAPVNNAAGTAAGTSNQMFWPTVGWPNPGSAPPELSPLGPSSGGQSDATAGAAGAGSGSGTGAPSSTSSASPQLFLPSTTLASCPDPTWKDGRYCGPAPEPGNGSGPGGQCSGHESTPPCGGGVVVGTYYAYTLPVRCDGRITFNGRRWESDLLPPTDGPDLWGWMRLGRDGHLRFVSPDGTVGFSPALGHATSNCGGTP